MTKIKWVTDEPRIKIDPTKRNKRLTGTRFPSVIGADPWKTPFEVWCAITRTYEEPFVDNKYTIAGKAIEPIIIQYLKDIYFGEDYIITPEDVYGEDYFKQTWGNFFPDEPIFGGMWDALVVDEDKEIIAVIEIKTTKNIDKWEHGAPDYQALQGALYANRLGVERVIMVVGYLQDEDYISPENFKPRAETVHLDEFLIHERYPDFDNYIAFAEHWWEAHVTTGASPYYDTKKDAEILKALRTVTVAPDTNIIAEANDLYLEIEANKQAIKPKTDRLKQLEEAIKENLIPELTSGKDHAIIEGNQVIFTLTESVSTSIDKEALEADGLLDKYTITKPRFTLRKKEIK